MVNAAAITKSDVVLEVGPGLGHLTEILAAHAKKVIAVEKDRELVSLLMKHETLSKNKNVKIIHGDILKLETWLPEVNASGFMLHALRFKIVANIPYYITSRFLRLFLSKTRFWPKLMVLMVQREVAKRICAKPPHMNLLALSVQLYAKPEIIRRVSKGQFSPPPKVDSAIIKITPKSDTNPRMHTNDTKKLAAFACNSRHSHRDIEKLLSVARIAFQQKRKMLRHSFPWLSDSQVGRKRPEELSLEDWAERIEFKSF